jgi:small subunit ribosomal protein S4
MGHYTGPKNRLSRREGIDLGYKTAGSKAHATLLKRLGVAPGQHGAKGKRKQSEFGLQLREKQKVKRLYGVMERQFRKTFSKAMKVKGNTGEKMLELLERRLDNVVYRMGLSPTRGLARQLVSHNHILVDGKKVNIPSFQIDKDMVVSLGTKGTEVPAVKKVLDDKSFRAPVWMERKGPAGKVVRLPERTDIVEDINEQLIVEYYSR